MFLRQCLGIDISKDSFSVQLGAIDKDQSITYLANNLFANNPIGFEKFDAWATEHKLAEPPLWYVMEATGVYYENLAYHIHGSGDNISVIMPSRAKFFAKSLDIKSKTDKIDARILARFGLGRTLRRWQVLSPKIKEIRAACREYRINKNDITRFKCRKHALEHSHEPLNQSVKRLEQKIKMLTDHCCTIESELRLIVKSDNKLDAKFDKLTSAPGLGFITVACVVGETNGFAAIQNRKQLASYAGLDIVHKESGTKKAKTRISKRGNKYLRLAVHMPALSAIQYNPQLATFYSNLILSKDAKAIGVTAVSRKLLLLAYTLWKKDEYFQSNLAQSEIA